jgi:hypothetical protein
MQHDAHDDTPPRPATIYALAAAAEIDPRTAAKAIARGPATIRTRVVRDRTRAAMLALGLLGDEGAQ